MKNKTLQACLPKKYRYKILGNLSVTIHIHHNPYEIPMDRLFLMAARQNRKRGFLFVSKVLGKHIPVNPYTSLLAGAALAVGYMKGVYNQEVPETKEIMEQLIHQENCEEIYRHILANPLELPEPTVFIGFAETATALGHTMFDCFDDQAYYIHTTREAIPGLPSAIDFEEEHSHATTHRCYPLDDSFIASSYPIVLVDDEITTGKTALNMIEAIHKKYPRKEYAVVSLVDWRTEEDRQRYQEVQRRLGIHIHAVSLVSGCIEVEGGPIESHENLPQKGSKADQKQDVTMHIYRLSDEGEMFQPLLFSSENSLGHVNPNPYLKETGRFGILGRDKDKRECQYRKAGEILGKMRKGGPTLCLGTGEFMYLPMRIAGYMGEDVKYHSTTRSPIHPCEQPGYGAQNKFSFESPEDPAVIHYLYNIPYGHYNELFLFLERDIEEARLEPMIQILKGLGIPHLYLIICGENNEKIPAPSPMGSYDQEDVVFLLKDVSNVMEEQGTEDREEAIQSGIHYSEMLPIEYKPSAEYMQLFYDTLQETAAKLAVAVGVVGEMIVQNRGQDMVLVSLARAGTPIGILIKRYLRYRYGIKPPHYSISIIRGKGIDENAIKYILKHHPNRPIQFIDGWTGKGAITQVLHKACQDFQQKYGFGLDDDLAVLADPGYCVSTFGTREDFLIASACLNATVAGLVSRTVEREDLIGKYDFHGAKYYRELVEEDVSYVFIDRIVAEFPKVQQRIQDQLQQLAQEDTQPTWAGLHNIEKIQKDFAIHDINLIKPGIGETTRVLLRRVPWKILVKDKNNPNLKHILLLAEEKKVPVEVYEKMTYQCCGLIKPLKES